LRADKSVGVPEESLFEHGSIAPASAEFRSCVVGDQEIFHDVSALRAPVFGVSHDGLPRRFESFDARRRDAELGRPHSQRLPSAKELR
jgi:hypothetical protein